ncbi:oligosaccharide flippase family protein [Agrobacterium arsenijevicii]|uniref:Sugar transporter n=1 Tax=Agrobacterium arsenijevicii TaxID=1585697 RepID=A0ABR5D6Y3_9HYPH|nr:sugar transporter [Agrobacterium arsenijevicii]
MHKVRRAFFMAMLEQHLGIAVNFTLIAIVSRLLSPAEVGFAVIGYGVTSVIFAFREFVSSDFLIQLDFVERDDINTSLTLLLLVSGILGIILYLCGPYVATFYDQPGLQHYLVLAIVAVMAESLGMPAFSMLRRQLAFGTIARVRTIGLVVMAVVTIVAARNGWGFVSFALGMLAGNSVASALAAYADPAQRAARLSLKSWRRMAEFGRYRGATTIVDKLYESLPQLVLGLAMTPTAVAIYNRANTVCSIPDRIFLSAIFSFAFPALAAEVREGGDVRKSYLRALSYITVLYWPSLIMVAILADPIVRLALGDQWLAAIPITRILALASTFWFPMVLTTPLLIALNANREAFLGSVVCRTVSATVLCSASFFGLTAAALSQFVILPFQMLVAFYLVRRHAHFKLPELFVAIGPSAAVTLAAIAGPLAISAWMGFRFDYSLAQAGGAIILSVAGWAACLILLRHPLLGELRSTFNAFTGRFRRIGKPPAPASIPDTAVSAAIEP